MKRKPRKKMMLSEMLERAMNDDIERAIKKYNLGPQGVDVVAEAEKILKGK